MANTPLAPSGRLDSWKAIAAYLNRDIRTVRRWEQLGLPVRRIAGGRGASVFAYKSEIDAWLKEEAAAGLAPPPRPRPPARRRAVAAALLVLLTAAVIVVVRGLRPGGAAVLRVEMTPAAIVARDGSNSERWRYTFPREDRVVLVGQRTTPTQIAAGGGVEIVAATSYSMTGDQENARSGQLLSFTSTGRLRRTFSFGDVLRFGAGEYGGVWGLTDYRVREVGGRQRVAVAAHHYTWWPSLVTVLDDEWRRRGTFVNAGWIDRVHWVSDDRLAIAGFSEIFNGGMLAVLDANALEGQSPAPPGSPHHCTGCGPDRPLKYIVMPRSEVNVVGASRFNRVALQVVGDRLLARTIEVDTGEAERAADVLYEFTPALDLVNAAYSDRYWDEHRLLEQEGKLTHSRDACPDRDGPRTVHVWEPATGWTVRHPH